LPKAVSFESMAVAGHCLRMACRNRIVPEFLSSIHTPRVVGPQFEPIYLYHPVLANRTFPAGRGIERFCGDFRPLNCRVLVSASALRVLVGIFGALSLHPKLPFPAAGLERESPTIIEPWSPCPSKPLCRPAQSCAGGDGWSLIMLNDRENMLSALREKPLKVYEIMKRANVVNEEACQSLLLKVW